MKFEHVNFNEEFWKDKSEAEFIAHESHHGLDEKQLKEAWSLMHNSPKKETDRKTSKKK